MKITLEIDDELLAKAKELAAHEQRSLDSLIDQCLRMRVGMRSQRELRSRSVLPVYRGRSGLATGIDPSSNRSMLDAAEGY